MAFIKLQGFSGTSPRTGPTLLQNNQAQIADNVRLQSGELRSWKDPIFAYAPTTELVHTIYRLMGPEGDQYWLTWENEVDIAESPIFDVEDARIYYTGDGVPKKTNSQLATSNGLGVDPYPNNWYHMGVPAPTDAPTLALSQPLTAIVVTNQGSGYTAAPAVSFSGGGGAGAVATAKLDATVSTITVLDGGSGYTKPPIVTATSAEGAGMTATASIIGSVNSITITSGGTGYTSAPTVTITGDGAGAAATCTINGDGEVDTITMTSNGAGYTVPPQIQFSGGGGQYAAGNAVLSASVSGVVVNTGGSGFIDIPTIEFQPVDGVVTTAATAEAAIVGHVSTITLDDPGSGYSTAPIVTLTGDGVDATAEASFAPAEARAYIYTYVNQFGEVEEESAPSPATLLENVSTTGATVTVSGFSAPPTSNYNITKKRIYRSVAGTSDTVYLLVAEIPIAQTTYADTVAAVDLGQALPSLYWTPPPTDLQGIVALPNGFLAGFRSNEVWFSEPFHPHAWPESYVITTESAIVGLGVYETTLVVATKRNPYAVSGGHPAVMTQAKLPMVQPCVSRRSIASDQYGVIYASPNGLVCIGPGMQDIVTQQLYTRDEWQQLAPSTMLGMVYNNMYIGFHASSDIISGIVVLRGDTPPLINLNFDARAVYVERSSGDIFALSDYDNKIYQLDADPINNTIYEWKSKKFVLSQPTNFGAFKVQADYSYMQSIEAYNALVAEIVARNQALFSEAGEQPLATLNDVPLNDGWSLNGSILGDIPPYGETRTINVGIYADGELVYQTGVTSQEPMRLPAGFKSYNWEVVLSGNTPVRSFVMASTISELRQVEG